MPETRLQRVPSLGGYDLAGLGLSASLGHTARGRGTLRKAWRCDRELISLLGSARL